VGPNELERRRREHQDALGPAPRAELLHVLTLPDDDRADRIGVDLGNPGINVQRGEPYPPRTPERGRIGGWPARRGRDFYPAEIGDFRPSKQGSPRLAGDW
jgi:hypothetical protein